MDFFDWIIANKEWIFSGIGVFLIAALIGFYKLLKKDNPSNNIGIQAGRDVKGNVIVGNNSSIREEQEERILRKERREEREEIEPAGEYAKTLEDRENDQVYLGASTPPVVSPSEIFVTRFVDYTEINRSEVNRILELEAPLSQVRLDLDKCRWYPGAKVMVRLEANNALVCNPVQTFEWNGTLKIIRFDVKIYDEVVAKNVILKFDIAVEGFPIMTLRPEIEVVEREQHLKATAQSSFLEKVSPKNAFASYATEDRRDVLSRVRSLQIFTGIDVFLDCLSLQPGETWKLKLRDEISNRDIFWLFWSRNAMASKWVEWEWRTALALKSLTGIQPHPLEPLELAPPPKELSDLQFGAMYEWYISRPREPWLSYQTRILCQRFSKVKKILKL